MSWEHEDWSFLPREIKKDIYVRIMIAAQQGRGVRLTYDECFDLAAMDTAFMTTAFLNAFPHLRDKWEDGTMIEGEHLPNFATPTPPEQEKDKP